jgi:hypothetical protein
MIDDDTNKQLLRINDDLLQLCKWLNERRDLETSSRLIPLVDDLTHSCLLGMPCYFERMSSVNPRPFLM